MRSALSGTLTAAVVAVPLTVAVVASEGAPLVDLSQSTGTAWVASPAQGLVTLVDGVSEQVVANVPVAATPGPLQVEQAGASAYVVDEAAGTVLRVDGATFRASAPEPLGSPGDVRLLRGEDDVYVLDGLRRTAVQVDPRSLAPGRELSVAAQPGPGQALVDGDGRLWVLDPATGRLVWFAAGRSGEAGRTGPSATLVLVRGRPVVVDVDAGSVAPAGPDGIGRPACLDVRAGDVVELLGSATEDAVYAAVEASGTLVAAHVGGDDCRGAAAVGTPGASDFGALAQSGPFVFVPDHASGATTVVDTRTRSRVTSFELVPPGHRLQLVAKDGLVFWNDLDAHTTGVLALRGGRWVQGTSLDKYDPVSGAPAVVVPEDGTGAVVPPRDGGSGPPAGEGGGATEGGQPPQADPTTPPVTLPTTPPVTPPVTPERRPAPDLPGRRPAPGPGTGAGAPAPSPVATPPPVEPPPVEPPPVEPPPAPGAPDITSLTADRAEYPSGARAEFRAVETAAGATATWSWTFQAFDTDGTEASSTTTTGVPGEPFVAEVGASGRWTYTVTLRVTLGDLEDSESVTVTVHECQPRALDPLVFTATTRTVTVELSGTWCLEESAVHPRPPPWLHVADTVLVPPGGSATTVVELVGEPPLDGMNPGAVFTIVDGGSGPSWDVVAPRGPRVVGAPRCAPGVVAVDIDDADPGGVTVTAVLLVVVRHEDHRTSPPTVTEPAPTTRTETLRHDGGGTFSTTYPRTTSTGVTTSYYTVTIQSGEARDADGLMTTFGAC